MTYVLLVLAVLLALPATGLFGTGKAEGQYRMAYPISHLSTESEREQVVQAQALIKLKNPRSILDLPDMASDCSLAGEGVYGCSRATERNDPTQKLYPYFSRCNKTNNGLRWLSIGRNGDPKGWWEYDDIGGCIADCKEIAPTFGGRCIYAQSAGGQSGQQQQQAATTPAAQPSASQQAATTASGSWSYISGPFASPREGVSCGTNAESLAGKYRCIYYGSNDGTFFTARCSAASKNWETSGGGADYETCLRMCKSHGQDCIEPLIRIQADKEAEILSSVIDNYPEGHVSTHSFTVSINGAESTYECGAADACSIDSQIIGASAGQTIQVRSEAVLDDGTVLKNPGAYERGINFRTFAIDQTGNIVPPGGSAGASGATGTASAGAAGAGAATTPIPAGQPRPQAAKQPVVSQPGQSAAETDTCSYDFNGACTDIQRTDNTMYGYFVRGECLSSSDPAVQCFVPFESITSCQTCLDSGNAAWCESTYTDYCADRSGFETRRVCLTGFVEYRNSCDPDGIVFADQAAEESPGDKCAATLDGETWEGTCRIIGDDVSSEKSGFYIRGYCPSEATDNQCFMETEEAMGTCSQCTHYINNVWCDKGDGYGYCADKRVRPTIGDDPCIPLIYKAYENTCPAVCSSDHCEACSIDSDQCTTTRGCQVTFDVESGSYYCSAVPVSTSCSSYGFRDCPTDRCEWVPDHASGLTAGECKAKTSPISYGPDIEGTLSVTIPPATTCDAECKKADYAGGECSTTSSPYQLYGSYVCDPELCICNPVTPLTAASQQETCQPACKKQYKMNGICLTEAQLQYPINSGVNPRGRSLGLNLCPAETPRCECYPGTTNPYNMKPPATSSPAEPASNSGRHWYCLWGIIC
jgi:hypothetical protein